VKNYDVVINLVLHYQL